MGRDESLAVLHRALQDRTGAVISAIAGMGGVGKTELAVQYAMRHRAAYPSGICWLKAREGNLEAQILQLAELQLGCSVPQEWRGRVLTLAEQVQWCWQNWPIAPQSPDAGQLPAVPPEFVLIVLDDVTNLVDCQPLLPTDPRFRVLITTRQRGLDTNFFELSLDVLLPEDAQRLLARLIEQHRVEREPEAAAQLCEWLGNLPLGLELVGRYVAKDRGLSLATMLEQLKAQRTRDRSVERDPNYDMTAQHGVEAAFELSWQTLNPATAEVALLLSLFEPDAIPWELVERMMQHVYGDGYSVQEARQQLDNSYLMQPVDEAGNFYILHSLIRQFLQTKLAGSEAAEPLKQAVVAVLIAIAKQIPQTPTRDVIEALAGVRPHLEVLAQDLLDSIADDDLTWAFLGLARFYNGQGLYALAEPWYQHCLSATQTRFGEEHLAVATSLNNLAFLYDAQGRYEVAEPYYEQALAMCRRLLGDEHPAVATSLNNLAELYRSQGRYGEAEPYFVQALAMRKRLLGEEHPAVATSLNNLALLYSAQRRYGEAEPYYVQALAMSDRLLGANHPLTTTIRQNLEIFRQQMRTARSRPIRQGLINRGLRWIGRLLQAVQWWFTRGLRR